MRITVAEEPATYGRIQEVDDGEELQTCFICETLPDPELSDQHYGQKYCSQACKSLHLPPSNDNDKEVQPYPFRVLYRPEVGRYMVAARDIQPGEVLFADEPLAMGPSHQALPCCPDCMKPLSPGGYLCPLCNMPVCEEMCAMGEEHAKECCVLQQLEEKLDIEHFDRPRKFLRSS